jgi:hypothetical protein
MRHCNIFGQTSPPEAAAHSESTSPLHRFNVGCSNQPSTISLLTAANNASTSEANRRRGRDDSGLSDEDEPSQKKLSEISTLANVKMIRLHLATIQMDGMKRLGG